MSRGVLGTFLAMLFAGSASFAQEQPPVRVACLGDSITAGQGTGIRGAEAARLSYPAFLRFILGKGFDVRGFGAGGHALRSDANLVYGTSEAADRAVAFAPDIAVIMLGTNDTCVAGDFAHWARDFDALAARLTGANPKTSIWLASPPQMFPELEGLSPGRNADLAERQPKLDAIVEIYRTLAADREAVQFVDVRDVLRVQDVVDGVHPTPFGAQRLAYRFAETLLGESVPRTTTAVPSAEYRGSAAGWGSGTWWQAYASLVALGKEARAEAPTDVLFLGDSITQGLTGHIERWSRRGGMRIFDEYQGQRRAVSLGLSGDRTEHLLYRIQEGSLDGFRPTRIVLQVGINNVNAADHNGPETASGIVQVIKALEARFPEAQILSTGPFPGGLDPESRLREEIQSVHRTLRSTDFGPRVCVLDLSHLFVGPDGAPLETLAEDGIHITPAGQRKWMEAIEPYLVDAIATRTEGQFTIDLGEGVLVELDPACADVLALTVGAERIPSQAPSEKEWMLDDAPIAMTVSGHSAQAGAIHLDLEYNLPTWDAYATRHSAAPNAEELTETWRLARLGGALGYDRHFTTRSRRGELNAVEDYASITTRSPDCPLALKITDQFAAGDYGYSTVSDPGITYDIRRIKTKDGTNGWWFRSGYHLMNQTMNAGLNPSLREVVLLEPRDGPPVPYSDVVNAFVGVPQDRASLLSSRPRETAAGR